LSGGGVFMDGISVPKENLLANGTFSQDSYAYVWKGTFTKTENGVSIAEGNTIQQTVTVDCGGIGYQLAIECEGEITVVVEYGSLTDGETTIVTLTLKNGVYTFTPTDGSTMFTVKITAGEGGAKLQSATVTIA
jgi:hypothetical protein